MPSQAFAFGNKLVNYRNRASRHMKTIVSKTVVLEVMIIAACIILIYIVA